MTLHDRTGAEVVAAPAARTNREQPPNIVYRLGGRNIPYLPRNSRCKVCNSDYLIYIERNLIKSYGYTLIWNSLPEDAKAEITVRNITDHAKNHLVNTDDVVAHAAVRQRSEEIGLDIEASTQAMVDHISFARVGLQKVYAKMIDGELDLEMKDGIALANFLAKVEEASDGGVDRDTMAHGYMAYLDAIQRVCTLEQMRSIQSLLDANPVVKAISAQRNRVIDHPPAD